MKERQDKIREEVLKTLESLEHFERLKGNPYLYTRIKQRIDNQSSPVVRGLPDWWPALAFTVLLLANVWATYAAFNHANTTSDALDNLAYEYQLNDTDFSNYYTLD